MLLHSLFTHIQYRRASRLLSLSIAILFTIGSTPASSDNLFDKVKEKMATGGSFFEGTLFDKKDPVEKPLPDWMTDQYESSLLAPTQLRYLPKSTQFRVTKDILIPPYEDRMIFSVSTDFIEMCGTSTEVTLKANLRFTKSASERIVPAGTIMPISNAEHRMVSGAYEYPSRFSWYKFHVGGQNIEHINLMIFADQWQKREKSWNAVKSCGALSAFQAEDMEPLTNGFLQVFKIPEPTVLGGMQPDTSRGGLSVNSFNESKTLSNRPFQKPIFSNYKEMVHQAPRQEELQQPERHQQKPQQEGRQQIGRVALQSQPERDEVLPSFMPRRQHKLSIQEDEDFNTLQNMLVEQIDGADQEKQAAPRLGASDLHPLNSSDYKEAATSFEVYQSWLED